jgi:hypothetical protein
MRYRPGLPNMHHKNRELPPLINHKKVVVFNFSEKCTNRQKITLRAF